MSIYISEVIATISKEMTAIRRLSKYLKKISRHSFRRIGSGNCWKNIWHTCNRSRGREQLPHGSDKTPRDIETIGKLYGYPSESLFLTSDFQNRYSLNWNLIQTVSLFVLMRCLQLDEQIERLMVIHQMLGTRISDTLTLQRDCLYRQNGHPWFRSDRWKQTHLWNPSVQNWNCWSKSNWYTEKMYGDTIYIL